MAPVRGCWFRWPQLVSARKSRRNSRPRKTKKIAPKEIRDKFVAPGLDGASRLCKNRRHRNNTIMNPTPLRVAVTGAAGQIGYSLLFRIASGAMFGPNQQAIL